MSKDRISELENKISEAFKAGNRARKKESVQDMSGMSERYPDEPDPEADKGGQLDTEPMFNRLRDWMTKLGWSVSEGDIHYFTIKMDSGDPVLGEIEADISTDIGYGKTRGYNLDFYLEFSYWPWEVNWYRFCARFIPGMSYRNEAFLDWNGFCRFITDLTVMLRNPGFAEAVRKFASNYMIAVLKRGMSNSDYILSILFQEIVRDKFGFDFVSDKFRYTLYKSTMMDSHQKAYYELLDQAHAIGACINWDPDPKILEGYRQQRIADMKGDKPANEAFRAGNRARKKESVRDTAEIPMETLPQNYIRYFSEYAVKTITECGITGHSSEVTGPDSLEVKFTQLTDSDGEGLPYGELEVTVALTDLTFDGKRYHMKGHMTWKDTDGYTGSEDFSVKCPTEYDAVKNAWMKIGTWIEFGSNLHAEPNELYYEERLKDVMEHEGIGGKEVHEAFRAGNRARKKESVRDTVEGLDGDRLFRDFDDFKAATEGLLKATGLEMNAKIDILPDTINWYGITIALNDDDKPYSVGLIFRFVNIGQGDKLIPVGDRSQEAKELPGFNEALHNGIERFDIMFRGDVSPNDNFDANTTGISYRITVSNDWRDYKPEPMFMPIAGWNVCNPDVPVNYAVLTYSMLQTLVDNIIVPFVKGYHDSTDLKDRLDMFRLSVMSRVDKELNLPKKPEGPGSGTWRHGKDDLLKSVRRLLKKDGLFRFRAVLDTILSCNGRLEKDSRQEYINPYGLNYLMPDDKKFFQDLKTEYYGLFKDRKPFDVCI